MMKNILTVTLLLLVFNLYAQINGNGGNLNPINPLFLTAYQSSTSEGKIPAYGIDGIPSTRSETNTDNPSWFWIEMQSDTKIKGIQVNSPNLKDYYIFLSKAYFVTNDVNELLTDPWVDYIHISEEIPDDVIIPVNDIIASYILIVPPIGDPVTLSDVTLFGSGPGDPGHPEDGEPCEECPDPEVSDEPWYAENCDNGIDDDLDGLVDCDDPACGVGTVFVTTIEPSCATCNDGKICVRSANATHFSIDNGQTWTEGLDGAFVVVCFDDLPPGSYEVVTMNDDSGCTSPNTTVVLSGPPDDGPCADLGFENGFDHWTGVSGDNHGGTLDTVNNNIILDDTHAIISTTNFSDPNVSELTLNHPWFGNNIARVGQTNNGADFAQLTYCFTVDADDPSLTIAYAFVANNPDHGHPNDPFFTWRYFLPSSPNQTVLNGLFIDSHSPTLTESDNHDWVYSPFDCNVDDLSAFIGQEICIEITAAECAYGAHQGYAYIDLACGDNPPAPIVDEPVVVYAGPVCDYTLEYNATGSGEFFTSYNWTITKIDENGVESNPYSTTVDFGVNPTLDDLINLYTANVGDILSCGDQIKVQLNLYNNCASESNFVLVDYPCDLDTPSPTVTSINTFEISCDGFEVDVEGTGLDFEAFSWTLSRVTAAGNVVSPFTTPNVSTGNPTLQDVINVYIDNMGPILECDEQLQIQLNLFHECGTQDSDTTTIDVPCLTWKSVWPHNFSPFAQNPPNQTFSVRFGAMDYTPNNTPECSVMGNDITTITYFRLQIFDETQGKIFDDEAFDSNGNLTGLEVKWDGTINGTYGATNVYSFIAYVRTCGRTKDCYDCGPGNDSGFPFAYCSTGETFNFQDINGNPIVVEKVVGETLLFY